MKQRADALKIRVNAIDFIIKFIKIRYGRRARKTLGRCQKNC
jgi:hypothetical protein